MSTDNPPNPPTNVSGSDKQRYSFSSPELLQLLKRVSDDGNSFEGLKDQIKKEWDSLCSIALKQLKQDLKCPSCGDCFSSEGNQHPSTYVIQTLEDVESRMENAALTTLGTKEDYFLKVFACAEKTYPETCVEFHCQAAAGEDLDPSLHW